VVGGGAVRGDRRGVMLALALFVTAALSTMLLMALTRSSLDAQGARYRSDQLQARATAQAALEVALRFWSEVPDTRPSNPLRLFTSPDLGDAYVTQWGALTQSLTEVEVRGRFGLGDADAGANVRTLADSD